MWLAQRIYNKTRKKIWIVSFFAMASSLRMKRNAVVFEQQDLNVDALCHAIKWRIALWPKA